MRNKDALKFSFGRWIVVTEEQGDVLPVVQGNFICKNSSIPKITEMLEQDAIFI